MEPDAGGRGVVRGTTSGGVPSRALLVQVGVLSVLSIGKQYSSVRPWHAHPTSPYGEPCLVSCRSLDASKTAAEPARAGLAVPPLAFAGRGTPLILCEPRLPVERGHGRR